jgi:hypothetical protein
MIKLVCGIFFLMITNIHASEYLEDIDLEKAQKVLSSAKADQAWGTIYTKIYTQARKLQPLKGSDSESLFLNLYFSVCFLAHQETEKLPLENLSDNSYRNMLAPLGSYSRDAVLAASSLTGILSRVSGIFDRNSLWEGNRTGLQSSFARLITGQGRFTLEESTKERKRRLIMDIYRHYNLNDPMFGRASKRGGSGANIDLLWNEIVGNNLNSDKRIGGINATQEHTLSCFIVAYLAASSAEYRLGDVSSDLVSYLMSKLGINDLDKQQTINQIVLSFHDIISSQITSNNVGQDVLDAFYSANLQKNAEKNARLNQQFDIFNSLNPDDGVPSLKTCVEERLNELRIGRVYMAHSLGVLSFQTKLTSYSEWQEMMKVLDIRKNIDRFNKEVWEKLDEALSKNPLRKSLFSFFEGRIEADKITASQKRDPRYPKEKTLKQIQKEWDAQRQREQKAQQEQAEREAKAQKLAAEEIFRKSGLKRLPETEFNKKRDNWEALKADWNRFITLKDVIDGLESELVAFTDVLPNFYQILNGTEIITVTETQHQRTLNFKFSAVRTLYKKLAVFVNPDKNPGYDEEFKYLGKFLRVAEEKLKSRSIYSYLKQSPLWNKDQADLDKQARLERERRDGEERQRRYGASDFDGNPSWY